MTRVMACNPGDTLIIHSIVVPGHGRHRLGVIDAPAAVDALFGSGVCRSQPLIVIRYMISRYVAGITNTCELGRPSRQGWAVPQFRVDRMNRGK
jgi:hypothetical protein